MCGRRPVPVSGQPFRSVHQDMLSIVSLSWEVCRFSGFKLADEVSELVLEEEEERGWEEGCGDSVFVLNMYASIVLLFSPCSMVVRCLGGRESQWSL